MMNYAYDRGLNTFDVADAHSNGVSEEIVGAFLKKYNIPRTKIVIMSKILRVDEARGPVDPVGQQTNDNAQVNPMRLPRKHIFDAVDASMKRLGTYIGVLQIHRLDRDTSMEEIMRV
jgi:versiconal hemiacetal acetate reductase